MDNWTVDWGDEDTVVPEKKSKKYTEEEIETFDFNNFVVKEPLPPDFMNPPEPPLPKGEKR